MTVSACCLGQLLTSLQLTLLIEMSLSLLEVRTRGWVFSGDRVKLVSGQNTLLSLVSKDTRRACLKHRYFTYLSAGIMNLHLSRFTSTHTFRNISLKQSKLNSRSGEIKSRPTLACSENSGLFDSLIQQRKTAHLQLGS